MEAVVHPDTASILFATPACSTGEAQRRGQPEVACFGIWTDRCDRRSFDVGDFVTPTYLRETGRPELEALTPGNSVRKPTNRGVGTERARSLQVTFRNILDVPQIQTPYLESRRRRSALVTKLQILRRFFFSPPPPLDSRRSPVREAADYHLQTGSRPAVP